jgi:hypothetical protein
VAGSHYTLADAGGRTNIPYMAGRAAVAIGILYHRCTISSVHWRSKEVGGKKLYHWDIRPAGRGI